MAMMGPSSSMAPSQLHVPHLDPLYRQHLGLESPSYYAGALELGPNGLCSSCPRAPALDGKQ